MFFDNNEFCYPLDDSFIHLAISKNIAENGVFGITQHEFVSSSSSPVYTLILAFLIKIFGNNVYLPLVINLLIALIIITLCLFYLEKFKIDPIEIFFSLLIIIICTPLAAIATLGMEHTLHILISLMIYFNFFKFIENGNKSGLISLSIIASIAVVIRYESLASVGFIFLYLNYKKQYKKSMIFLMIAISLFFLFGLFSMISGGYLLPNSILVKGSKPIFLYLEKPIEFLTGKTTPILTCIFYLNMIALIFLKFFINKNNSPYILIGIYVLFITLGHIIAGDAGYLYRYEAYLMFINLFNFCLFFFKFIVPYIKSKYKFSYFNNQFNTRVKSIIYIALFLIISVFAFNSFFVKNIYEQVFLNRYYINLASRSIYIQQYQTAKFLQRFYNNSTVVANDIGAICYFTDIKLFDLVGLGSNEKLKYKFARKEYDMNAIKNITENKADIAIIYDSWFEGKIPSEWIKICDWISPISFGVGDTIVSFYAINHKEKSNLIKNLNEFETYKLNRNIRVNKYFE